jgi:hypothetical protein
MQTAVLAEIGDPSLRAHVVWVPILKTDQDPPDQETRALVPDGRAVHYWDADGIVSPLFAAALGLSPGYPAWDVYLIYGPDVRWEDGPPTPVYWHHQLPGVTKAPFLDGDSFARQLRLVLAEQPGGAQPA